MASFVKKISGAVVADLRSQYTRPVKSLIGNYFTKKWAAENRVINEEVVNRLNVKPNSHVLEIGYGHGEGIAAVLPKLREDGLVFGLELSTYMRKQCESRFFEEIADNRRVILEKLPEMINLPFPNDQFDAIFHVDVFYFWGAKQMPAILSELKRVLKPDGKLLCGMELNSLKKKEDWGIVSKYEYDPMKYMIHLEPTGFKDVKLEYVQVPPNREIQIINARKPSEAEEDYSPEAKMEALEEEIKEYLAMESLMKSQVRARVNEEAKEEKERIKTSDSNQGEDKVAQKAS